MSALRYSDHIGISLSDRSPYLVSDDIVSHRVWEPEQEDNCDIMRNIALLAMQHMAPTYVVFACHTQTSVASSNGLSRFLSMGGAKGGDRVYCYQIPNAHLQVPQKSNWLKLAESGVGPLTFAQVGVILDELSRLLSNKKFFEIDEELSLADVSCMSVEAVVTVARTTFSARSHLRFWPTFVARSKNALEKRGVDLRTLAGLI